MRFANLAPAPWKLHELPPQDPSKCVVPVTRIKGGSGGNDLAHFHSSLAHQRITSFIYALNLASAGSPNSSVSAEAADHEIVRQLVGMLDVIDSWVEEIEPLAGRHRFGNAAFRDLQAKLEQQASTLLAPIVQHDAAVLETSTYLCVSFGNPARLDYGSGHELSFVAFLACLALLRLIPETAYREIVLVVFKRYMKVVHNIISRYTLEPAGSHGVWGLDDYRFLSYYFGSAQLVQTMEEAKPDDVLKRDKVKQMEGEYLYFWCIQRIYEAKNGPFFEHSPMLYDISGVPTWYKVNQGLGKMYLKEVLSKFPVVQHFLFGHLLPYESEEKP